MSLSAPTGGSATAHAPFGPNPPQAPANAELTITIRSGELGQAEASFKLLKRGAREVVFENLAHDFPQRVMYRLDGDTLIGRIEGTEKGKPGSAEFPMRRVECEK